MKVILDIPTHLLTEVRRWTRCEGFKLEEDQDGFFRLILTANFEKSVEADAELQRLLGRDG